MAVAGLALAPQNLRAPDGNTPGFYKDMLFAVTNGGTIYAFDVEGVSCDAVGSVLLNDVVDCAQASGPIADCVDQVSTRSRAKVPFKK